MSKIFFAYLNALETRGDFGRKSLPIIIESYLQPYNSTMERKATYLLLLKLSIDIPMTLPFNMC